MFIQAWIYYPLKRPFIYVGNGYRRGMHKAFTILRVLEAFEIGCDRLFRPFESIFFSELVSNLLRCLFGTIALVIDK